MTTKLIALYTRPENVEEFEQKYFGTHVPLISKVPGLLKMDVMRMTANMMGGETPYYMMAELHFENRQALDAAMSSPEGKAAGANIMGFAGKNISLIIAETATMDAPVAAAK